MNQLQQAKPQAEQIAKSNWLSQDEKKIIKAQFFPPNATDMDMIYCMKVAETFNLNPILKQIFFVERSANIDGRWITKIEPLAGRDSFLTLAHRSGKFAGIDSDCAIKQTAVLQDGEWVTKNELVATARVYRTDNDRPFCAEVEYSEYVQRTKDGSITKFWRDKPKTMLKKVAESQALRKAFDISGLYSVDEVGDDEPKKTKIAPKIETKATQNLNELLSSSEKPNISVGAKNSQTEKTEYIEAAPLEVEIATVKENLTVEPMPHDLLQSELVKRGASEAEAENLVERLSIDEARAYLDDPNSIDALMENLRS
ncbi:phage recombination protein Bet [Campylobacter sp. FOBRC14]|uniref:phage recombination protein Bet n=1 Tax=Campylobacter sp. FOBRC14 TaxID=936554 RepID=UPI00027A3852|nr:phage recombination protein Bet [Campylobacter sp. FOBRC14]EJP74622.1 phage recombination protein Bet [Campylobacter sp. FOBRC14]